MQSIRMISCEDSGGIWGRVEGGVVLVAIAGVVRKRISDRITVLMGDIKMYFGLCNLLTHHKLVELQRT